MELIKPEPLVIGGKATYTLTSYDPISITVHVPFLTEEEIDYACEAAVVRAGGTVDDLNNDIFIAEHFEGISSAQEFRAVVTADMRQFNTRMAEEQKVEQATSALAARLVQRVPEQFIASSREYTRQALQMTIAQMGLTVDDYMRQMGITKAQLDELVEMQARAAAEGDAAMDAWIAHRKITIADEEIARYLGVMPSQAEEILAQAAAAGELEDVRLAGLRAKALEIVIAEANCTYEHETEQEANERVRASIQERAMMESFMQQQNNNQTSAEDDHPHLKLV